MSKSPNVFWPALGVTGIVLGAAYGINTRGYKAEEAAVAMAQAQVAETRAAEAATAAEARVAEARAEMEATVARIQQEAMAKAASAGGLIREPAPDRAGAYGLGRPALAEEIAAWDVDVSPDGTGLPEGRGDVLTGEEVFAEKCAVCHGDFAEGVDNWPVLAGGFDTLADKDPVKTVGSYWPYLSTVWDYVHRSMPFGNAQSLTPDEVYAITAYILYSNDLVDEEFELSHENFAAFEMYNKDGFIVDDRAETEYAEWRAEPCMTGCKDAVQITMRASVLDVTPEEEGGEDQASMDAGHSEPAAAEPAAQQTAEGSAPAALNPQLVAAGESVFKKCKACHQVGENAANKSGPQLNGLLGRVVGSVDGFRYSTVFKTARDEGRVWDADFLAEFLANPKGAMKGTKMSFAGLKSDGDIEAVTEYLRSFDE